MNINFSGSQKTYFEAKDLDPFVEFLIYWERNIGNYVKGYVLPIGILLSVINNLITLYICGWGREAKRKITPQMRIYYSALAIFDTSTAIFLHGTYFGGL